MKKFWFFGLVLVCSVLLAANTAGAATWTVCGFGCSFTTITAAVAGAADGDIIKVKPGIYSEAVLVNKSLQIVSTGGKLKTFVIAPAISSTAFWVASPGNVLIQGFTIRGGTSAPGVYIGTNNVRVRYCTIEKGAWGIYMAAPAANVKLAYNQVRYNTAMSGGTTGIGIMVFGNAVSIPNVIISYNQINDNDYFGVMTWGAPGALDIGGMKLEYNTLVNNGSFDLVGPSNNNWYGFKFQNTSGNITMNYNKIRATSILYNEIGVVGPATPTFTGTGNLIFPNNRQSLAGPGSPLVLP